MHFIYRFTILILLLIFLNGCVAIANNILTIDENDLIKVTARDFGVTPEKVTISDIDEQKSLMGVAGTTVYYNTVVNGKPFRCMVGVTLGEASTPFCGKQGEPMFGGGGASPFSR